MKVKAVEKYYDLVLARHILEGEEAEMTDERALELAGSDNAAGRPLVTILEEKEPSGEAEPPAAVPDGKEPPAEGDGEGEPPAAVPDGKKTSGRGRGRGTNGQKGTAAGTGGQ